MECDNKHITLKLTHNMSHRMTHLCDGTRLHQLLLNYLSNAVKFTGSGGSITINCELTPCAQPEYEGWDDILLEVTDTGIGIEDPSKLFVPYMQATRTIGAEFGGTGLGLSIAKTLTELMSGHTGISSELGMGTRVWSVVRLKRAPELDLRCSEGLAEAVAQAASAVVPPTPPTTASPVSPKLCSKAAFRILVAEDNKVNEKVVRHMLQRLGFTNVSVAPNGRNAVDLIEASMKEGEVSLKQRFNLVLMDCMMPVMDGYEATRLIREMDEASPSGGVGANGRLPVVALTASASAEDRDMCKQAGMDSMVTKPIMIEQLQELLEQYVSAV